MRFLASILISAVIAGAITFGIYNVLTSLVQGASINADAFELDTKPTTISDRDDNYLVKFYQDRRTVALYDEIPKEVVDAFISTEDRDFFEHPGINIQAIIRAFIVNAQNDGQSVQGGSTITQQLIKISHLTNEKTYERKIKEMVYSFLLEEQYPKKEILEMYLNQIEYKYQAFGIKDAMNTYYEKTFPEFIDSSRIERIKMAALMAGMVQNPTLYDPWKNVEGTTNRRNIVLKNMMVTGKITKEEYDEVVKTELGVVKSPKRVFEDEVIKKQELVHYALKEAGEILGMTLEEIRDSGYDIETSFDQNVYDIIRKEAENNANFPRNVGSGSQKMQTSMVYITPKNGEIIAFTGSRDEITGFMDYNRAFQMKRQPGSTMKPVLVFGPALESGKFTPDSLLLDKQGHVFPGGYVVRNWDGGGRGYVTMKEAIRQSWNIPTVWTLQQVGVEYAKDYAKNIGLDLSQEPNYLGIGLGGLDYGVNALQMADAYQVYANEGYRTEAHAIRRIIDKKGTIIYEKKMATKNIIDVDNAVAMKDMLINAVQRGTGGRANFGGKVGGKTGSTEHVLRKGATNDMWFVGFHDDDIVGSIWMGMDKVTKEDYTYEGSGVAAALFKKLTPKILNEIDDYTYADIKKERIEQTVVKKKPPEIKLNGEETVTLEYGEPYVEYGAVARDENHGDLTNLIHVESNIDVNVAGEYEVKYQLLDGYNVISEKIRRVIVREKKSTADDYNKQVYYTLSEQQDKLVLSWDRFVEDNVSYIVYKNNQAYKTIEKNEFIDNDIAKGNIYNYQIAVVNRKTGRTITLTNPVILNLEKEEKTEPEQPSEDVTKEPIEDPSKVTTPVEKPTTDGNIEVVEDETTEKKIEIVE